MSFSPGQIRSQTYSQSTLNFYGNPFLVCELGPEEQRYLNYDYRPSEAVQLYVLFERVKSNDTEDDNEGFDCQCFFDVIWFIQHSIGIAAGGRTDGPLSWVIRNDQTVVGIDMDNSWLDRKETSSLMVIARAPSVWVSMFQLIGLCVVVVDPWPHQHRRRHWIRFKVCNAKGAGGALCQLLRLFSCYKYTPCGIKSEWSQRGTK